MRKSQKRRRIRRSVLLASLWPHCADYGALLEAITRAESAEPAIEDAQIAPRGSRRRPILAADAANDDVGRFDAGTEPAERDHRSGRR